MCATAAAAVCSMAGELQDEKVFLFSSSTHTHRLEQAVY